MDGDTLASPVSRSLLFQRLLLKGRLRQIQMLVAVARAGSMQQAARDLSVSQPAITKAVSEIEAELGVILFERHARGIRLTRPGKTLLTPLERILDATEVFADAVVAQRNSGSSVLRVASIAAGISGLLAACAPAFCQAHPDIVLRVDEIDGRQILSHAARDEFDIFVCRTPEVTPDGWTFVPVVEDEHAIMAAPTHPLAGRSDVTLGDLRACTWLMPPSGVPAEALIAALFADGPMPPHFQMPTRSRTLNRAAVTEMGLVTAAPASIFRAELRSGTLVRINYPLSGRHAAAGPDGARHVDRAGDGSLCGFRGAAKAAKGSGAVTQPPQALVHQRRR